MIWSLWGAKFERKNRRCATCWEAVVPRERLQCGAVSSRLRVYVWLLQPNKTHPIKLPLMMRLPDHISCKKKSNQTESKDCSAGRQSPSPFPPAGALDTLCRGWNVIDSILSHSQFHVFTIGRNVEFCKMRMEIHKGEWITCGIALTLLPLLWMAEGLRTSLFSQSMNPFCFWKTRKQL